MIQFRAQASPCISQPRGRVKFVAQASRYIDCVCEMSGLVMVSAPSLQVENWDLRIIPLQESGA
jgi:hypothetical protein